MDEVVKYKRFRICCCKPFKDKNRLMKTGRLTVVGEVASLEKEACVACATLLC